MNGNAKRQRELNKLNADTGGQRYQWDQNWDNLADVFYGRPLFLSRCDYVGVTLRV